MSLCPVSVSGLGGIPVAFARFPVLLTRLRDDMTCFFEVTYPNIK